MIKPHGGKLINTLVTDNKKEKILAEYNEMVQLKISEEVIEDINNISHGVFSPIEGFMGQDDVHSIISTDRLANDIPWTIPITLDVSEDQAKYLMEGEDIALINGKEIIGILHLEEKFAFNKEAVARSVYQTLDLNHPGVAKTLHSNDILLSGKVEAVNTVINEFKEHTFYPEETRAIFKEKGWKTVVGFQTRNVPHLGHEYVQKTALTLVDGLFINPIIGKKKVDDFLDPVILGSYQVLIDNYYRKDKAMMGILRTRMRYAGPKEAIFHSIMRKNFGCTHFIVGRDHAGVGNYYGPFDAHTIFEKFPDIDIKPICFRSFFICEKCSGVVNDNTCPHEGTEHQKFISGQKIRKMIQNKELSGLSEYMRSEVAEYLIQQDELFVK
ncbi:MAG: sulfate adenylyltransferase [Asgard group archaeon]|nr:sulfate adenylyltransferase [Asgard group archaeon]